MRRCRRWLALAVVSLLGCRDREPLPTPSQSEAEAAPPAQPAQAPMAPAVEPVASARLRIHHASALSSADLARVEHLDLALSVIDQLGHLEERDVETACDQLDLGVIAMSTPMLRSLRISGCDEAIRAGLAAFGSRLETLTLADVALDSAMLDQLGQLRSLTSLTLTRIDADTETVKPLAKLQLRRLELRELEHDSPLAEMTELWPDSLREVVFAGSWAGHDAMTSLSKAQSLESLELRDTRVGNFSLNQIKPLLRLRSVSWHGNRFNDNSPLYIRDLPIERFECACPRLGDGGLRSLRHSEGVRHLELRHTRITGAGLQVIGKLSGLRSVVIGERDIGPDGLRALAALPELERLELSGTLENPLLEDLAQLETLRSLTLHYPELDDRVAPQLAKLTHLEHLDLSGTRFSDEGLSALGALAKLREISLHHTRVTNRGLAHIGKLGALEVLELDHTDVVDTGVAHISSLKNLRELTLDHTLITDAAIDHLLGMTKLERLGLGGTVITAEGAAKLVRLPALEAVSLADTRIARN